MPRTTYALALAAALLAAALASADTLIVLNKFDATASLIDPATGAVRATVGTGIGPHEAAASPDGKTVVVCDYGGRTPGSSLTIIDLQRAQTVRRIDLGEYHRPHGIVFLDDDRVAVTAEAERALLIVNVRTGVVESAIDTASRGSHMVAVTPDGRLAFVANIGSGSAAVIDLEVGERVKILETGAGAEGVAAHPVRPEVWVTNRDADTVSVIDTRSLEVVQTLRAGRFPIRVRFTPDGSRALVSCAHSGDVWVYDGATRDAVATIDMDEQAVGDGDKQMRLFSDQFGESPVPVGILIRPDGRRAYVANTNADVVSVIDLDTLKVVDRLRAGREPDGLAWSPLP
ncbi:MAG: YncE family protein [Planctomycetota bacterium]|nr:MAG: YncE family protein [Planctomycetota bacterium]